MNTVGDRSHSDLTSVFSERLITIRRVISNITCTLSQYIRKSAHRVNP